MSAAGTGGRHFFVRTGDGRELGPLSVGQVRRALLTSGDPNPDYAVQETRQGTWRRASTVPEFADIFDPAALGIMTVDP